MKRITLFPGDGIGPEITESFRQVCDALGADVAFDEELLGERAYKETGSLIPESAVNSLRRNKVALKAPCTTPVGRGFRSVNVQLRVLFDLYINFRPAKTLPNTPSRYENIDLATFRENTEDLYIGDEYETEDGFIARKKITRSASERIIRAAFEWAAAHKRQRITCVHKANILKKTDGLFLEVFNEVAEEYAKKCPALRADDRIIDNMCMQLVTDPEKYDTLVAPNLYGDIITDLIAGLVGGLGMAPAANIGRDVAVFEAVHGSAPDIAGLGIANPTAFLLSGALMLEHIGLPDDAARLRGAIEEVLSEGKALPRDLGGVASTDEYTHAVIANL